MRLLEQAQAAADVIHGLPANARVRVVAKNNADGVAAAAIAMRALMRAKRAFHISYVADVDDHLMETLRADRDESVFFLGLGHGFMMLLDRLPASAVIIDYDKIAGSPKQKAKFVHLNPRHDPAMPANGACASTLTFAFAVALNMTNQDLAGVALVGVFSTGQDSPMFRGWNKDVYETAVARGLVHASTGIALPEAPLVDAIRTLPGPWTKAGEDLGDPTTFLAERGLAPEANLHELPRADLEQFTSLIVVRGLRRGLAPDDLGHLFRSLPRSAPHQDLPLPRIVNLVASAAAEGDTGVALSFLLGDLTVLPELEQLETKHHEPHHRTGHGHVRDHHG